MYALRRPQQVVLLAASTFLFCLISISNQVGAMEMETKVIHTAVAIVVEYNNSTTQNDLFTHRLEDSTEEGDEVGVMDYSPARRRPPIHN
ncbi:hypothetical protein FRX31_024532 [Thalictrum thalictroides]|uniref:Root meristem growth factor n=1 Tax=Thalictrum thalictroides TaxID=46969 RepID=A0A7J6VL71_THATH|nr:hypothetical protein FRX31_024532 [Thalictrum thalictroides]